jgi:predicted transcriptional regulator YdeE
VSNAGKGLWSRVVGRSALVGLGVLLVVISVGASSMQLRIVEQQEFQVIGILARTSNSEEMSGHGIISAQWGKLFKDGILDKVPNKVDSTIYAVYTSYESDRNGKYDFLIGGRVSSTADVPPGMVARKVPKGRYAVLTTAEGPVEQIVPRAWQRIWSMEDRKQLGGARAYKTDFEVYDERSRDPKNSQVDLHVGLK